MPAAWDLLKTSPDSQSDASLAVIVPNTGETSIEWAAALRRMKTPVGSAMFFSRGLPIDATRDQITTQCLDSGYEWLFYLDSDVIVPTNVIETLVSHQYSVVSGLYMAKRPSGQFCWGAWAKQQVESFAAPRLVPVATWDTRIVPVDVVGAGCLLVHRRVFEDIRAKSDLPFFFWTKERDARVVDRFDVPDPMMRNVSEDFWFCLLAKACGHQILVDSTVRCGHIATTKLTGTGVVLPEV